MFPCSKPGSHREIVALQFCCKVCSVLVLQPQPRAALTPGSRCDLRELLQNTARREVLHTMRSTMDLSNPSQQPGSNETPCRYQTNRLQSRPVSLNYLLFTSSK